MSKSLSNWSYLRNITILWHIFYKLYNNPTWPVQTCVCVCVYPLMWFYPTLPHWVIQPPDQPGVNTCDPALPQCWATVYDVGPALSQRWVRSARAHAIRPLYMAISEMIIQLEPHKAPRGEQINWRVWTKNISATDTSSLLTLSPPDPDPMLF